MNDNTVEYYQKFTLQVVGNYSNQFTVQNTQNINYTIRHDPDSSIKLSVTDNLNFISGYKHYVKVDVYNDGREDLTNLTPFVITKSGNAVTSIDPHQNSCFILSVNSHCTYYITINDSSNEHNKYIITGINGTTLYSTTPITFANHMLTYSFTKLHPSIVVNVPSSQTIVTGHNNITNIMLYNNSDTDLYIKKLSLNYNGNADVKIINNKCNHFNLLIGLNCSFDIQSLSDSAGDLAIEVSIDANYYNAEYEYLQKENIFLKVVDNHDRFWQWKSALPRDFIDANYHITKMFTDHSLLYMYIVGYFKYKQSNNTNGFIEKVLLANGKSVWQRILKTIDSKSLYINDVLFDDAHDVITLVGSTNYDIRPLFSADQDLPCSIINTSKIHFIHNQENYLLLSFSPNGNCLFVDEGAYSLDGTVHDTIMKHIAQDDQHNIYIAGELHKTNDDPERVFLDKYNYTNQDSLYTVTNKTLSFRNDFNNVIKVIKDKVYLVNVSHDTVDYKSYLYVYNTSFDNTYNSSFYNDEEFIDIANNPVNNSIYIISNNHNQATKDTQPFHLIKLNNQFNFAWSKYDDVFQQYIRYELKTLSIDNTGNLYIYGIVTNGSRRKGFTDYSIIKSNINGLKLWEIRDGYFGEEISPVNMEVIDGVGILVEGYSYNHNNDGIEKFTVLY